MHETEFSPDDIDERVDLTDEMEQRSAELYDILCQYCIGDALRFVRSVDDMRGIEAWQKLFKKYNPRTMARGLRLLMQTVNPLRANELSEVDGVVSKWEESTNMLSAQFGETLSDKMQMAIFTNMMPSVIQDYIYTHVDKKTSYEEMKDKVKAMVSNKLASNMAPAQWTWVCCRAAPSTSPRNRTSSGVTSSGASSSSHIGRTQTTDSSPRSRLA